VHIRAYKALGIIPTPMAFPEEFTALQQGTVDGQENP
jgi:TRAP-type C4-dicarboxylate transport system substrate-binding protein